MPYSDPVLDVDVKRLKGGKSMFQHNSCTLVLLYFQYVLMSCKVHTTKGCFTGSWHLHESEFVCVCDLPLCNNALFSIVNNRINREVDS